MGTPELSGEPLSMQELVQEFAVREEVVTRHDKLVFSLINAMDCGDDALAMQYEADIAQIYAVTPGLQ